MLESPTFRPLPAFYEAARQNRFARSEPTRVIELEPAPKTYMRHMPQGSIVTVTGLQKSPLFDEIARAAAANSHARLEKLLSEARNAYWNLGNRKVPHSKTLPPVPSFAEYYYGDKLISGGQLAIPELECMASLVPFAGGQLDHGAFRVEQLSESESTQPLQHLVLVRQPVLTDMEKMILKKAPSGLNAEAIGDVAFCGWPGVLAGLLVIGALFLVGRLLGAAARRNVEAGAGDAGAGDAGAGDDDGERLEVLAFYEKLGHIDPASAASVLLAARSILISAHSDL